MPIGVIFSNHHRFAYVVTPKVACSSIKRALLPVLQEADLDEEDARAREEIRNFHKYVGSRKKIFMTKANFEREMRRGRFGDFFRFSFVRNPWDRIVSCYESKIVKRNKKRFPLVLPGGRHPFRWDMSFEEYLRTVCEIPDAESNVHFRSQAEILTGSTTGEGKLIVEAVGRFEQMSSDFPAIMARALPGRSVDLGQWNVSGARKRDYREYFRNGLEQLVADRYPGDLRLFGYEF